MPRMIRQLKMPNARLTIFHPNGMATKMPPAKLASANSAHSTIITTCPMFPISKSLY